MTELPVWKIIPFFKSTSIAATVDFYRDNLRFICGGIHSNGESDSQLPVFCSVFAGEGAAANIYFLTSATPSRAMVAFKDTESLQLYYRTLKTEGKVDIVEDLEDKEWGYRQFCIQDPDGNQLIFFSFIPDQSAAT